MKSLSPVVFSALAAFGAAVAEPDHVQVVSVTCSDAATVTVTSTVTTCVAGQTPAASPGSALEIGNIIAEIWQGEHATSAYRGGSIKTVTVTSPPVTVTVAPPVYTELATATTAAAGSVTTHFVDVGAFPDPANPANKLFQYRPNNITAAKGDVVKFNMLAAAHSVTQSQFLFPCIKNGTFDTGLIPNPQNISNAFVQTFVVDVTTPLWFYCKQTGHCGKGMVFGINPKSDEQMAQFIAAAIAQNGTTSSPPPTASSSTPPSTTATYLPSAPIKVVVGQGNGTILTFDPPFLPRVAPGQVINFDFRAVNHTLTESSFADPCTKLAGTTVDTNFEQANKADIDNAKVFPFTVDSDKPRWFYCKQGKGAHCKKGMVFAINTDQAQFSIFQTTAENTVLPAVAPAPPAVAPATGSYKRARRMISKTF